MFYLLRATAIILTLCILGIAAITPHLLPMGFHTDKFLHIFIFCSAAIIVNTNKALRAKRALCALSLVFLGLGIESLQYFTPDRTAELNDVLSNIAGITLGLWIGYLLRSGYYAETKSLR